MPAYKRMRTADLVKNSQTRPLVQKKFVPRIGPARIATPIAICMIILAVAFILGAPFFLPGIENPWLLFTGLAITSAFFGLSVAAFIKSMHKKSVNLLLLATVLFSASMLSMIVTLLKISQ